MRWVTLGLPLTLVACLDPTQITVDLYKDGVEGCGDPAPKTAITIARPSAMGATSPAAVTDACAADTSHSGATARIGSLVAVPHDDPGVEVAIEAVMHTAGGDPETSCVADEDTLAPECIVARRQLRFLENTMLELPILLQTACAGVFCEEDQTCIDGGCTDAEVDCSSGVCDEPDPPPPGEGWLVVLEATQGLDLGGMVRDGEGNVYVAGTCNGSLKVRQPGEASPLVIGNAVAGSTGVITLFVVKLGPDGSFLDAMTATSTEPYDASRRAVTDLSLLGTDLVLSGQAFVGSSFGDPELAIPTGGLVVRINPDLEVVSTTSLNPVAPTVVIPRALATMPASVLAAASYDQGTLNTAPVLGAVPPHPVGAAFGSVVSNGSGASDDVTFLYSDEGTRNSLPPLPTIAAGAADGSRSFFAGTSSGAVYSGTDQNTPLVLQPGAFVAITDPQTVLEGAFGLSTDAAIRVTGLEPDVVAGRLCMVGHARASTQGDSTTISMSRSNGAGAPTAIVGSGAAFGYVICPEVGDGQSLMPPPSIVLEGADAADEVELLASASRPGTLYLGGWASATVGLGDESLTAGDSRPFVAAIDPVAGEPRWSVDLEPPNAKLERLEIVAGDGDDAVVAGQMPTALALSPEGPVVEEGPKIFIRRVARPAP